MKRRQLNRSVVGHSVVAVLGTAIATVPAQAGTPNPLPPVLTLSPTEVEPGGEITVTADGMCSASTESPHPVSPRGSASIGRHVDRPWPGDHHTGHLHRAARLRLAP